MFDLGHTVSDAQLEHLKHHRYNGSNESVLYNAFLKPFARYLVELLPPWVAPNVLTVAGLGLCWVNFVLMAVLNPRMDAPVPRWAYIVCAVNVFVYQMLDNMDGQHARRIGATSPLGQLLDHGCDSMAGPLSVVTMAAAIQCGPTGALIFVTACQFVFFAAQWDEYHTKEMYLPALNGADEGIFALVCAYIFLAVAPESCFSEWSMGPLRLNEWVPLWIATGSVFHAYEYYGRVRKAIGLQGKSTPPTGTSMHSKIVLVKQFIPFGIYLLLSLLWVFFPAPPAIWFGVGLDHPSSGNERPDLTAGAPFGTLACILLCYGYITCKLIVANVCGQEYSVWQPALVPLSLPVLNGYVGLLLPRHEGPLIHPGLVQGISLALTVILFLHFVVSFVGQVTGYLGISCFRVECPAPEKNKSS